MKISVYLLRSPCINLLNLEFRRNYLIKEFRNLCFLNNHAYKKKSFENLTYDLFSISISSEILFFFTSLLHMRRKRVMISTWQWSVDTFKAQQGAKNHSIFSAELAQCAHMLQVIHIWRENAMKEWALRSTRVIIANIYS